MSTRKSKVSSEESEPHAATGQHRAVRYDRDERFGTAESERSGFSGTCDNAPLADWIQLVQMGRREAVIGVRTHDRKKGLLWCRDGDIIDAWCDGIAGEDAVYRILGWEGGRVSVAFVSFDRQRRIQVATAALLLRAAYRRDSGIRELKRSERPPSDPSSATLGAPQARSAPSSRPAASTPPSSAPGSAAQPSPRDEPSQRRRLRERRRQLTLAGAKLGALLLVGLAAGLLARGRPGSPTRGADAVPPSLAAPGVSAAAAAP
jgi:hypothetical protein